MWGNKGSGAVLVGLPVGTTTWEGKCLESLKVKSAYILDLLGIFLQPYLHVYEMMY